MFNSSFFCELDSLTGQRKLKENHPKCRREWRCDFGVYTLMCPKVVYSMKHIRVSHYVLPKLTTFSDNCVLPKIISPVHHIGLPLHDHFETSNKIIPCYHTYSFHVVIIVMIVLHYNTIIVVVSQIFLILIQNHHFCH